MKVFLNVFEDFHSAIFTPYDQWDAFVNNCNHKYRIIYDIKHMI